MEFKEHDIVQTNDKEKFEGRVYGYEQGFVLVRLPGGLTLREESDLVLVRRLQK